MQRLLYLNSTSSNSELDFPLYDGPDISKFGIYLTVALNRCQESHELVYLLKGDKLRTLALKQRYFTDIFNISDEISQYIQVNHNVYISESILIPVTYSSVVSTALRGMKRETTVALMMLINSPL